MPTLSKSSIPSIVAKIKVDPLSKKVTPIVGNIVTTFGKRAVAEINSDEVFRPNRRVSAFIRQNQGRLIGVNKTTQRQIARVLAQGVDAGKTVGELADAVADAFDRISDGRAFNIARTTVTQASNFATTEGYRQAGVEEKEWLTTSGGDSRASHVAMDGQVRAIGEEFDSPGGGSAQYPGDFGEPDEDVNCQCGVLPRLSERSYRRRDRVMIWKSFNRARAPYDRTTRIALNKGFAAQKAVVVSAIRSYDDVAAAA